ncbi:hypothetical protein AOC36_11305 [Erysipelothrix larvae]|uniref:3-keto-disaccharide hydrolase domain-containing protein n=1 Tax=Erysipelothrix larvae TaxID=1514105 RepID=A0A0X8H1V2_9FIRM|nr:hypothetical protein [Erysipelothrix larvae]AMC94537.1 hypothetical protein AOC36_11305 [Erysipelothrix larvae]
MDKTVHFQDEIYLPINTEITTEMLEGEQAICVLKGEHIIEYDEPTYAKLLNCDFHNGIIKVKVLSRILQDAPELARGFIGLAFRINEDDTQFESIYIRPTNGRCELQKRRNCSTQYFSYPNHKYNQLRIEAPGEYESYADMGLDEWIDFKIEVIDTRAKLYLHNSKYPVLIVNDLKLGAHQKGSIGLWVDVGTQGFFKDLRITHF